MELLLSLSFSYFSIYVIFKPINVAVISISDQVVVLRWLFMLRHFPVSACSSSPGHIRKEMDTDLNSISQYYLAHIPVHCLPNVFKHISKTTLMCAAPPNAQTCVL